MNPEERLLLIDSLIDGRIGEADLLRIEAELIVDPEVRQQYYDRLQLNMLLAREASEASSIQTEKTVSQHQRIAQYQPVSWVKILSGALVTLAASVLLLIFLNRTDSKSTSRDSEIVLVAQVEPSASGFAVLSGQDGAVWSGSPLVEGDLLPSGELHLKSGRVHIELFSGVQMVIEGDAQFSIDSPMQVTMDRGIARARVPEPAQGFKIKTNNGDVIDLGTEFSIHVDNGGADVHVVDGEVELQPRNSDSLRIDAGFSRRMSRLGELVEASAPLLESVGPSEFQSLLRDKQKKRFADWVKARRQIETDPRLVAFYQLQSKPSPGNRIANLAGAAPLSSSVGSVVAATPTTDRWGNSDAALDFSRVGSRVRLEVPGEYHSLTMLCWIKINSLDRMYNSLFLTDGHEDREPHWQLMDDGRIFFSVKLPRPDGDSDFIQPVFYSPSIWDASLSGRWIMLAVTYDVDQARVTHYLNGRPISSESIPENQIVDSIRIGPASICNWSEPMYRTDPQFVLRNLNGSMDEFALYSDALSAGEILQLYRDGSPNEL
ncbi:LamG-like jellyroll fold domain-containing protein [Planctomycetaceae bacterium SH139]